MKNAVGMHHLGFWTRCNLPDQRRKHGDLCIEPACLGTHSTWRNSIAEVYGVRDSERGYDTLGGRLHDYIHRPIGG